MSDICQLAREGAAIMQQLRGGEDAALRGQLNEIARRIGAEWQKTDIESISDLPPYYLSISLGGLGSYVKMSVRGTNGTVAIDARDWPYRLIHYYWEKEIK